MERAEEAQFETFWARLLLGICVIELEGKQELSGEKMNQGVQLMEEAVKNAYEDQTVTQIERD